MEARVEHLSTLYESALRRADSCPGNAPFLRDDIVNQLNTVRDGNEQYSTSDSPVEIEYERGLTIARVALQSYSFDLIEDISDVEFEALRAAHRHVSGPIMEASIELDPNSDRTPGQQTELMLRDATRTLQTLLLDVGVFPPDEQKFRDAIDVYRSATSAGSTPQS